MLWSWLLQCFAVFCCWCRREPMLLQTPVTWRCRCSPVSWLVAVIINYSVWHLRIPMKPTKVMIIIFIIIMIMYYYHTGRNNNYLAFKCFCFIGRKFQKAKYLTIAESKIMAVCCRTEFLNNLEKWKWKPILPNIGRKKVVSRSSPDLGP